MQLGPADQARPLVDAQMGLVAEVRAAALAPPGVRIPGAARAQAGVRARAAHLRRDQRGVQQGALLDHQPPRLQLPVQFGEQPRGQPAPHQLQAEAAPVERSGASSSKPSPTKRRNEMRSQSAASSSSSERSYHSRKSNALTISSGG